MHYDRGCHCTQALLLTDYLKDLLTGTLLPGITRDTILQLATDLGLKTEVRRISTDEWREAATTGAMTEAFAKGLDLHCLTACRHGRKAPGRRDRR